MGRGKGQGQGGRGVVVLRVQLISGQSDGTHTKPFLALLGCGCGAEDGKRVAIDAGA